MKLTSETASLTFTAHNATYKGTVTHSGSYLGRGRACTAYDCGEQVLLIQRAFRYTGLDYAGYRRSKMFIDYGKHATKDAHNWAETGGMHLPKLVLLDKFDDTGTGRRGFPVYVWTCPKYKKLVASSTRAWQEYKIVERAIEEARSAMKKAGRYDAYSVLYSAYADCIVFQSLADAVNSLAYAASSYDNIGIEISPRNLMVGSDGQLILNDILFTIPK